MNDIKIINTKDIKYAMQFIDDDVVNLKDKRDIIKQFYKDRYYFIT